MEVRNEDKFPNFQILSLPDFFIKKSLYAITSSSFIPCKENKPQELKDLIYKHLRIWFYNTTRDV